MNEDYYHEQNSCYDPNSFGFDQFLPQPLPVIDPTPLEKGMEELRIAFQAWSDNIRQKKEEEEKRIAEEQAAKDRYWKIPICYDDDEDDTIAVTPVLLTEEPVDSLIMKDEHLDTILATELDEVIKSSVENLVPIPSESEGIPDSVCDMPLCNNPTPFEAFKEHSETVIDSNNDYSSSDDDSYENIDYVDASPPDSELVSLEVVESVIPEKSSGSTTTHADFSQYDSFIFDLSINPFPPANRSDFYHEEFAGELAHIISPSDYDHFYFKIEPELGNFTMDVVEDIFNNPTREPRVHVPNVLPTYPTLHLDLDFTISSDSLGSDLVVSFPSGTRNKIFDPGIFIGVQFKIFLSRDAFSISFIRDPFFDTLLPFSSENGDKVVNTGILAAGEEKSPLFAYVVWIFLAFLTYPVSPPYLLSI
ncbi:hypothetical protein Tco_0144759 [Tanacetum coccineum]